MHARGLVFKSQYSLCVSSARVFAHLHADSRAPFNGPHWTARKRDPITTIIKIMSDSERSMLTPSEVHAIWYCEGFPEH